MYEYMTRHEHLLTKDNKEGLEKVLNKNENYAFLMESSTIQYHTERICNITQIGDLIDDKNYAIGMRKSMFEYFVYCFCKSIICMLHGLFLLFTVKIMNIMAN